MYLPEVPVLKLKYLHIFALKYPTSSGQGVGSLNTFLSFRLLLLFPCKCEKKKKKKKDLLLVFCTEKAANTYYINQLLLQTISQGLKKSQALSCMEEEST